MQKTVEFTEETYDFLKQVDATGKCDAVNVPWYSKYSAACSHLGNIRQGAVWCDMYLLDDDMFKGEDFCIGGSYAIDAKMFLIGKDGGCGESDGIPYDLVSGFYGHLEDTYEDTLDGLVASFDVCVERSKELLKGIENAEFK